MDALSAVRRRPNFAMFLVFVCITLIGFIAFAEQREADRQHVKDNRAIIECLSAYAVEMTDALQDRDAVTIVARSASVELWATFRRLLLHPPKGDRGREQFLDALQVYLRTLGRVERAADLNPYPDPAPCLEDIGVSAALQLVSHSRNRCFGRAVTISSNDSVIHGTDHADVIASGRGADLIVSGKGRDRICAGGAGDVVNAGQGLDRVNCGRGVDNAQQAERRRRCEG